MYNGELFDGTTEALDYLIDYYQKDNLKWIVPFSGDQRSICLIELLFDMFAEIPEEKRTKEVLIVNAQTGIDFPHLSMKMNRVLKKIEYLASKNHYPITTKVLFPNITQSFWVHILGYGYPPPRSLFQWCAAKLKLSPIVSYLHDFFQNEEIVIVSSEKESDEIFRKHTDFPNTFLFCPMVLMEKEDVNYLLEESSLSVWDETNKTILAFYDHVKTAFQSDEPKDDRGVCGNTLFDYTFACWCCPFKREHESLREYTRNAKEGFWLPPLLRYRGLLLWLSQNNENRVGRENKQHSYYPRRKNNKNELKDYNKEQSETLTMETRERLLNELQQMMADLQREFFIHAPLIREEEIIEIKRIWNTESVI